MAVDRARLARGLPDYEVGDELGRGGFGAVFAGRHRLIHRDVAIKVLLDEDAAGDDTRGRFLTEARTLAGIDHSHVVRIYDYVERDGLCLLVMERLDGGSLRNRLAAGLSQPAACAIGLAAAAGLSAAHHKGVLHRDIKPDNLLFTDGALPKMTDFGIAKILERTATVTTGLIGTPKYMAPEQIAGERLSPATDIYSLGLLVYEMLAGRPPFPPSLTVPALLHHHLNVPPAPLVEVASPLADVVWRALEKDPGRRPATAEIFARELAAAAADGLGPGWLPASHVPVMLDDEVRALAGSGSGPGGRPGGAGPVAGGFGPTLVPTARLSEESAAGFSGPPSGGPSGGGPSGNGPGGHGASGPGLAGYGRSGPRGDGPNGYGLNGPGPNGYGPSGPGGHGPAGHGPGSHGPGSHGPGGAGGHDGWAGQDGQAGQNGGAQGPGSHGRRRRLGGALIIPIVIVLCVFVLVVGLLYGRGKHGVPGAYAGATVAYKMSRADGVAFGRDGSILVTTGDDDRVIRLDRKGHAAPLTTSDGKPVAVEKPAAVAFGPKDAIYIGTESSDGGSGSGQVFRLSSDGRLTHIAGAPHDGFSADEGLALSADLDAVNGLAVDDSGDIYLTEGHRVRKITPAGRISTVAGTVQGEAMSPFYSPDGIALGPKGAIYVTDSYRNTVSKIEPNGSVSVIAGSKARSGSSGDGGPARAALLNAPSSIAVGPRGALYIVDADNGAVREIGPKGIITRYAGNPNSSESGDGVVARSAYLGYPSAVTIDSSGALYVTEGSAGKVRRIGADGIITTVLATP